MTRVRVIIPYKERGYIGELLREYRYSLVGSCKKRVLSDCPDTGK